MEIVNISGEIGWEVMPIDIIKQLEKSAGADLDVHIASPGGYVFDGIEIFNAFRDYKRKYPEAQIMATVKGLAASMASYISVNPVFDLVVVEDNAVFMIHNPYGFSGGDYKDHQKAADVLSGLTDILAQAYVKKTGKSKKEISDMMDSETWLFGSEIVESGFADEIISTEENSNKAQAVATAKLNFQSLSEKLSQKKEDVNKIAAMIQHTTGDAPVNNINPAEKTSGQKPQEVFMDLKQFITENPAAKIELNAQIELEKKAGFDEGQADARAAIDGAVKYLAADSEYPAAIKAQAIKVIKGESGMDSLEAVVIAYDAFKETNASNAAKADSADAGDTPAQPQTTPQAKADGVIDSPESFLAEIEKMKVSNGVEVR